MPIDKQHSSSLSLALSPSWLSGLIAVITGLVVAGGMVLIFTASSSQIQEQLIVWQHPTSTHKLTTPDQVLKENDKQTLQGSWPLLIFWSILGLVVYAVATTIIKSIGNAEAFRESLGYVHAKKLSMLAGAALSITFRLVVIGLWALFAVMFFKRVIPYSITAAHASAADVASVYGITYALLSFLAISLSLHLHTVLMRLSLGKARLFNSVV